MALRPRPVSGADRAAASAPGGRVRSAGVALPAVPADADLRRLAGSTRGELPVAGVAQARHDVAYLAEVTVNGGQEERHVRMGGGQGAHALRGGDQSDVPDAPGPPAAHEVHRGDGRAA